MPASDPDPDADPACRSLGGAAFPTPGDSPLEAALDNLATSGVVVVVSAGNNGQNGACVSELRPFFSSTCTWRPYVDTSKRSLVAFRMPGAASCLTPSVANIYLLSDPAKELCNITFAI